MNADLSAERTEHESRLTRGIMRRFVQIVITILLQAAILFLSSGELDWVMAWVLIVVNVASAVVNSVVLLRRYPALIAERGQGRSDAKRWDLPLAGIVSLWGPMVVWLVAGLDKRFGWSPQLLVTVQLVALGVLALGYVGWGWAMASNRFFAGFARIQEERGHTVATEGPYRYVRHPGYISLIVFTLAMPLVLGSLWALIPAILTACTAIARTSLEDKMLQDELAGYTSYAQQVRYRLVPGVW
jgi:protein-S-isoprenylcysteine O-methyltransferase Ste14